MLHPIPRMVRKRRSQNCLSSILDTFRKARNQLQDMLAVESSGTDKIPKGEPVKNCPFALRIVSEMSTLLAQELTNTERYTSHTMSQGTIHVQLDLVDRKMRAARPLHALLIEDVRRFRNGDAFRLD